MSAHQPAPSEITPVQRLAWILSTAVLFLLVSPLVDDLAHGRGLSWGEWVGEVGFFVIGLSLAMGLVSAALDLDQARTGTPERLRRRTFWLGVLLLPLAWLLLIVVN